FVVEQLRDAVLVLDAYDRVVDANLAAQHSLGLPAGGLIGRSADEILPHWGLAIDRIAPEDMVHEQVRTGEGHLRRGLDVSMSPLVRGRGRPLGRLVVVRDVSESELAREAMRAASALEAQQEAEERTRREIAELLHGRVQTQLLVLKFKLGDFEKRWTDIPPEAQVLVHEIAEELERIREHDVRAASHRLFPSLLDLALTPAVFALAETYGPHLPVLVEVDPSLVELDSPLQSRLPMAVRETSYRVTEEALGNVWRHAQATRAKVALALEGHQLVIRIEDDGRGCDPTTLAPGLGIRTIAARVTKLGGTWRFTGAPGAGSTMMVTLPLAPAERAFAGDLLVHLRDSLSSEAGVALPGTVAGK
ncbi:MAG TPA: ATP-binding protein, partial [Chloroflexota bacterium]|nr:ATP-binding protein [Chloroflexota bacterium]